MFTFFRNTKRHRSGLISYLAIPFLLLYLAGTVELDSFHGLFHGQEEAELHTAQQEENSCHNAIYHKQKDNVCHHVSHIAPLKKCSLCHVVFHSTHLAAVRFSSEPVVSAQTFKERKNKVFLSNYVVSLASRGPPVTC